MTSAEYFCNQKSVIFDKAVVFIYETRDRLTHLKDIICVIDRAFFQLPTIISIYFAAETILP